MKTELKTESTAKEVPMLFVVWIDTNCGHPGLGEDWEMNSAHLCPAKPLSDALDEASAVRAKGWPTKVMPEGMTPRADGRMEGP